jgi:hypothetical protein
MITIFDLTPALPICYALLILFSGKGGSDLARIFCEWPTATADMAVLSGVLRSRISPPGDLVRLGYAPLRLPGDKSIFTVSWPRLVNNPGEESKS